MYRDDKRNSNRCDHLIEYWPCSCWGTDGDIPNAICDGHKRICFSKHDHSWSAIIHSIDYSRRHLSVCNHTNIIRQCRRMLLVRHIMLKSISVVPGNVRWRSQWCHSLRRQCRHYRSRNLDHSGRSEQHLQLSQPTSLFWIANGNLPSVWERHWDGRYGRVRCKHWIWCKSYWMSWHNLRRWGGGCCGSCRRFDMKNTENCTALESKDLDVCF